MAAVVRFPRLEAQPNQRRNPMKKLFYSSFAYMVVGVLSGLFYREYTKGKDFTGFTQLSVVHTHLLTLGFIVLLIVLILEKLFALSKSRLFSWFFWTYNAGLILTAAMMVVHGMLQVQGAADVSAAIPGIAGLGHILLSVAMVLLFLALRTRLFGAGKERVDGGAKLALQG
jgi:nitric oxide reductase large subunit